MECVIAYQTYSKRRGLSRSPLALWPLRVSETTVTTRHIERVMEIMIAVLVAVVLICCQAQYYMLCFVVVPY